MASQPKRNANLEVSLSETRMMIDKLAKQLEDDLYDLLKQTLITWSLNWTSRSIQ
ncbi:hypothetical protein PO124_26650 [Bacillus licheniformis]|nr:hypothetical protein [Bacillus licheniformis]